MFLCVCVCTVVTGLAFVVIRLVVGDTSFHVNNRGRDWGAGAELRPMVDAERIGICNFPVVNEVSLAISHILAKLVIGDHVLRTKWAVAFHGEGLFKGLAPSEEEAGIDAVMRVPHTEISHTDFLIFIGHRKYHVSLNVLGWGLSRILNLYSHGDGRLIHGRGAWESNAHPRPLIDQQTLLGDIKLMLGNASLMLSYTGQPSGQSSVNDDENKSSYLNSQTKLVAGLLFFSGGIALLCKVCWNCRFNYASRLNTVGHVTLVMLCACLMWLGMWLIGSGLGVFT